MTSASIATAPSPSSSASAWMRSSAPGQQRDAMAVGGQRAGGRLADARRGAGDDRDAAGGVLSAHVVSSFALKSWELAFTVAPIGEI